MSEMILAVFSYVIGIVWYGAMIWISGSGVYWMWRDKKSQPLQARINRLSYEIELIEGDKFKETPESTALRRARDLDNLELMNYEDLTEHALRTWGSWRWLKKDPFSPTSRWRMSRRAELLKNLGMDT